jgi:hypothetical protein
MRSMHALLVAGVALAVAGFLACNGDDDDGPTGSSDTTTTTTTPTTLPGPGACNPTPPPLFRMEITIESSNGHTRTLKVTPTVPNTDGYCDRVGFGAYKFCDVRRPEDPQRAACEALAVGRATDTGRWGPTWTYSANYEPAHACVGGDPGCTNHPSDQFRVIANGPAQYYATASATVPLSIDPDYPGSRNVRCWINAEGDENCN